MSVDVEIATVITCPRCGHKADKKQWDCTGACNDNVFCRCCHCEFDPDTREIHQCNTTAEQAALNREKGIWCL